MSTPLPSENPKIYLLPNLMTAGNLFCGFAATRAILEGALLQEQQRPPFAPKFHLSVNPSRTCGF